MRRDLILGVVALVGCRSQTKTPDTNQHLSRDSVQTTGALVRAPTAIVNELSASPPQVTVDGAPPEVMRESPIGGVESPPPGPDETSPGGYTGVAGGAGYTGVGGGDGYTRVGAGEGYTGIGGGSGVTRVRAGPAAVVDGGA